MDKKICLVTSFNSPNYGSRCQATALCVYLNKLGYDVSFLNTFRVLPYMLCHPNLLIHRLQNKLNSREKRSFFWPSPYEISENRKRRLDEYSQTHYKVLNIEDSATWKSVCKQNTCFIVGSDIVWQPANGYPTKYFLDFVYYTKLQKLSYATSIGAMKLPPKYYKAYKKYLGAFSHISVRERSAAELMEAVIRRKIETVVDPTLLLHADEWDAFAERAELSVKIDSRGFILCYFVMDGPRYWDYVAKVQSETGLQVVVLPMHYTDENQPYTVIKDGTPYEFIWLIKNATFICTDSFHACAFSLNYRKEFYLLRRSRKAEDAKYDDFLSRYGLESRCVRDEGRFKREPYIDYDEAHRRLEEDRQRSYRFLHMALSNETETYRTLKT